ncbi:ATP-binding cassette domain-containing protein [Dactylosporangium maewongense]|uniref:ATP-binding cassette domain-containing protein n=1 Tax=Dactylosporangium maewongense TaxID=634393 RepID=A0ABP4NUN7_9ACTN
MTGDGTVLFVGTGLGRTFGEVTAVDDVSCLVVAGDRIAVTGPSGSGKSTLLHLVAGIDRPTSGTATWPRLPGGPLQHPGSVGIVFQQPNLLPDLTALENVQLPLLLAGHTAEAAAEAAAEALRTLELGHLADRLPHELSGGQAHRVAVARAVAGRPELVVADEPTAALDGPTAAHLAAALLATVERVGAALLIATHDETVAARMRTSWSMTHGTLTRITPIGADTC